MHRTRYEAILGGTIHQQQRWERDSLTGQSINSSNKANRHPSWNEALIDLAIVASFSVLDSFLESAVEDGTGLTIFEAAFVYFICYWPLYSHWQVVDGYINRFGGEGISGMVVVGLNLFALSAANMALKGLETNHRLAFQNFIPALIGMQLVVIIMLLRVFYSGIQDAVFYSLNMVIYHVVIALSWTTILYLSWHLSSLQLLVCILVLDIIDFYRVECYLFIGSNISNRILPDSFSRALIPVHVTLLAERFGLFVVLAIGECVMSTVGTAQHYSFYSSLGLAMAVVQGYAYKAAYFDFFDCPGEFASTHALRISRHHGVAYMHMHVVATMSITMSSGLIAKVFEVTQQTSETRDGEDGEGLSFAQRVLYGASFAVALLSLKCISSFHERSSDDSCPVQLFGISGDTLLIYFFATVCFVLTTLEATSDPMVFQACMVFLFVCGTSGGFIIQRMYGAFKSPHASDIEYTQIDRFSAIAGSNRVGINESSKLLSTADNH